jgi:hypothetical protein
MKVVLKRYGNDRETGQMNMETAWLIHVPSDQQREIRKIQGVPSRNISWGKMSKKEIVHNLN